MSLQSTNANATNSWFSEDVISWFHKYKSCLLCIIIKWHTILELLKYGETALILAMWALPVPPVLEGDWIPKYLQSMTMFEMIVL